MKASYDGSHSDTLIDMVKFLPKMLCVEPSQTQKAILKEIISSAGLEATFCAGEAAAQEQLGQGFHLMLIANELADGDSFHLIETVRLSLRHATMPIGFVTSVPDHALAYNAMVAGATEVFARNDLPSIAAFIAECAQEPEEVLGGGTVLLLEDSPSHAEYVAHLCRMLGLNVDHATSVKEAVRLYRPGKYQLVVIDVVLDDIQNGITLVRIIRQNHASRQPIVVMSGYDDLPRRLHALKSGADDFVSKPFSPEEFVWRIRKVLKSYARHDIALQNSRAERSPDIENEQQAFLQMLTPREREIAGKVLAGMSDKAIAGDLGISFWTVRSHIEQIFTKTGALNRRDLIVRFMVK